MSPFTELESGYPRGETSLILKGLIGCRPDWLDIQAPGTSTDQPFQSMLLYHSHSDILKTTFENKFKLLHYNQLELV